LGFDRRWWFDGWVWSASDEEEMGFVFFPGDDGDRRWWSANWVWPAGDEEETDFVFSLAMMVTGEGGLPIGFAAAFSIFFWLCVLFWCFVFISSLCIFLKILMCHVVISGQKTLVFCHVRIAAALYV
jgi:hypothetical protein